MSSKEYCCGFFEKLVTAKPTHCAILRDMGKNRGWPADEPGHDMNSYVMWLKPILNEDHKGGGIGLVLTYCPCCGTKLP